MLELALIGSPNSGKSTFFKAATLKDVAIASYPFTTIEPNEGLAYVTTECPCTSISEKCGKCVQSHRFIPVKLWDVAGLVKDAHLGRGRGNAFLDDLMQAAAFIQVVDSSGRIDEEGNPNDCYPGSIVRMLDREIDYWLLGLIKKDMRSAVKGIEKIIAKRLSGLGISEEDVTGSMKEADIGDDASRWSEEQSLSFIAILRASAKPSIIAANKIDITGSEENVERVKKDLPDRIIMSCSAEIELALREAAKHDIIEYFPGNQEFKIKKDVDDKQKKALDFMSSFLERRSTNVQKILNTLVFEVLDMIAVFPVENEHKFTDSRGNILPDIFLMKKGSTARDLAYRVHEDIGRKFITAIDARTKKNVSADYELKQGDIISIKSGR